MEPIDQLIEFGRFAAARGWVPATGGNFSCLLPDRRIAITRSGTDKGALAPAEIAIVAPDATLPPGLSAETPLHLGRYRADPTVGAVLHVHSVAATVLSRAAVCAGAVVVRDYEMQKALAGIVTHEGELRIPVYPNTQDMPALSAVVEGELQRGGSPPGFLVAGHGLYAWGQTVTQARRHVEGFEFLFACELEERRLTGR
ncbi:MAG TPA: methylthioribulose 1-phosphate dehydratase [Candidatus Acidoferrales bacterium]|nr:methylthioribulose 1-phosphate dehydratase [Candidatus Acidoferrales bacterium]